MGDDGYLFHSSSLAAELCESLGLEPTMVRSLHLKLDAQAVGTITAEIYAKKSDGRIIVEGLKKRYRLVPIEDEEDS